MGIVPRSRLVVERRNRDLTGQYVAPQLIECALSHMVMQLLHIAKVLLSSNMSWCGFVL